MADRVAVALGADHAGLQLKNELVTELSKYGYDVHDLGTNSADSVDYPDYASKVTEEVTSGKARFGILVCGTGVGMSIAANKVHGIRAPLCHSEFEGRLSRQHNDANVLCLGQRVTGAGVALAIAHEFLTTEFEGGRHSRRIDSYLDSYLTNVKRDQLSSSNPTGGGSDSPNAGITNLVQFDVGYAYIF